jgi:hypothetical protein
MLKRQSRLIELADLDFVVEAATSFRIARQLVRDANPAPCTHLGGEVSGRCTNSAEHIRRQDGDYSHPPHSGFWSLQLTRQGPSPSMSIGN